jgi:YD repeat-containing protein
MQCPICRSEAPPAPSICSHCGAFISVIPEAPQVPANTLRWTIRILFLLTVLIIFAIAAFNIANKNGRWQELLRLIRQTPQRTGVAVVHGNVVQPSELQHRGALYFVPMGRQAISAESLADYYDKKFEIKVSVLREVPLDPGACLPARKQCVAEEMILAVKRAYPKIAADPDAAIIILTDEDLYSHSLGWNWTYSFYCNYRFGVISTRRLDPTFWHDPPNEAWRLASTHQYLTSYIAYLYFHVPRSYDPTSIMYQPLTPSGGPDDLYQSDLHSEVSANGRRGKGWPCLTFTYSYQSGEVIPRQEVVNDCYEDASPRSTGQATFQIELAHGQLVQRNLDLQLDSKPPISFRRAYLSQYLRPMALGLGWNHSYNTWLYSDGPSKLTFIDVIHEDGTRNHLTRISPGVGFSPNVVFEDRSDTLELHGSRMTWDGGNFKLISPDNSSWTYLPCSDGRCFANGFEDAEKKSLRFDRDKNLALRGLIPTEGDSVSLLSDSQARVTEATIASGRKASYEYDPGGCLTRVHRLDRRDEIYSYDSGHRIVAVSISLRPGAPPTTVLKTDYDSFGRTIRQVLADGSTYTVQYMQTGKDHVREVKVTAPDGHVLDTMIGDDAYTTITYPTRFPAIGTTMAGN